jgi:predicted dinucleotide-binding enzyme
MVVGLLGAGRMGETLARRLTGAGDEVRLADSRREQLPDPAGSPPAGHGRLLTVAEAEAILASEPAAR